MINKITSLYSKIRNALYNNRAIPTELSRWYFLMAISLLVLIAVLIFYRSMRLENVPLYRQVHFDFNESAHGGVGYVALDFNLVPDKQNAKKQSPQSAIDVDLGILPIANPPSLNILNKDASKEEEIVDSVQIFVNGCGVDVRFGKDYNEWATTETRKTLYYLFHGILYNIASGDSSFIAQWNIYKGDHTLKNEYFQEKVIGEDLFYPHNKRPAEFNLFLVINGNLNTQDSLLSSASRIVLNFDESSWTYDNIFPKPNVVSPSQVAYIGTEAVQRVLKNNGIYLQAKNENIRTKNQRLQYTYTIIISALLAFLFDIMVRLIIMWRKGYLEERQKSCR